jgi:hypothetical protein
MLDELAFVIHAPRLSSQPQSGKRLTSRKCSKKSRNKKQQNYCYLQEEIAGRNQAKRRKGWFLISNALGLAIIDSNLSDHQVINFS